MLVLAPAHSMVVTLQLNQTNFHWCQIIDNEDDSVTVQFQCANESYDDSNDDDDDNYTGVSFSNSHCKDAEHACEQYFLISEEETDGTRVCQHRLVYYAVPPYSPITQRHSYYNNGIDAKGSRFR